MAAPRKRRTWIRASHRWLGMILLIPLAIACITGLILNHTVDLGLGNRHLTTDWIQKRYGMSLQGKPNAYGLEGKAYAARWDGQLFHRNNTIDDASPLVGAVPLRDGTAVVTTSAVHYFGLEGDLIETLDSLTLPAAAIVRAGRTKDLTLVLGTASGDFTSDADLLEFTEKPAGREISWSVPIPPSDSDLKLWKKTYSGDGIPLDRLILDLHSGRFFGTVGKWIYDLTVIGVLVLSATGFILFLGTRRRAR